MNIRFYLHIHNKRKNTAAIYCYVRKYIKGKNYQLQIPTSIFINLQHWDKTNNRVKIGAPNAILINKKLDKIHRSVEAIVLDATTQNFKISINELFSKIKEAFARDEQPSILGLFDLYIKANENRISHSYLLKIKNALLHINRFDPRLMPSDINLNFVDSFANFLLNKGLTNVSIQKIFDYLKIILRWNFGRHLQSFDISFLKFKGISNDTTFSLDLNEIRLLANADVTNDVEGLTRDAFIFAVFTGLRFTDLKSFSKNSIDGNFIELVQIKTKQKVRIFLMPNAKSILEKYSSDKPFASLQPQSSKKHLRAIAKRIRLNRPINTTTFKGSERRDKTSPLHELISFHDARRSFATILTAANFNPDLIKAMTGHRTQREFEKYIRFSDEQLNEMANKFSLNFN